MPICPCCRQMLVRQATRNRVYWFCRDCRQAMPTLTCRLPQPERPLSGIAPYVSKSPDVV